MAGTEVICLWTNPRSLSTCLAYSFGQRSDTHVLDEPLHAHWSNLIQKKQLEDLGLSTLEFQQAEPVVAERDGNKVIDMILDNCAWRKKYLFCKNMAAYYVDYPLNPDLLAKSKNIILIRNPVHCLASLAKALPSIKLCPDVFSTVKDWSCILTLYSMLLRMRKFPTIVDAQDLQENPEGTLRALCNSLEIEFQAQMLKWEAGPKEFDVCKLPDALSMFYKDVHKSTGFFPASLHGKHPFPTELYPALRASWPAYLMFKQQAIKPVGQTFIQRKLIPTREALVWVDNELVPAEFAALRIQESGDISIHEDLTISNRRIFKLKEKLSRLIEMARATSVTGVPDYETMQNAAFSTAIANGMLDKARLHITLSSRETLCNCSCILTVTGENTEEVVEEEVLEATDASLIP